MPILLQTYRNNSNFKNNIYLYRKKKDKKEKNIRGKPNASTKHRIQLKKNEAHATAKCWK